MSDPQNTLKPSKQIKIKQNKYSLIQIITSIVRGIQSKNCSVSLCWVKGHLSIESNNQVNMDVKNAAKNSLVLWKYIKLQLYIYSSSEI